MLAGTTDLGLPVSAAYTLRGLLQTVVREGKTSTYRYDARGLFTQALLPTGDTFDLEYDINGKFLQAKHNGVPVTGQFLASASNLIGSNRSLSVARLRHWLDRATSRMFSAAWAQVVVVPDWQPKPPVIDPRTDLLMSPMSKPERAMRTLAEAIQRCVACDPNGGYNKPTLAVGSYWHMMKGGHLFPLYSDQSYFTVRVSQSLVDEVVTRKVSEEKSKGRVIHRAMLTDYAGKMPWPKGSGIFVETKKVTLVFQDANCQDGEPKRNEVITMYPGWGRDDGP
jgi:hypothetical protein